MYMKKYLFALMVCLMAGIGVAQAQLPAVTLKSIDGATVQSETLSNDGKPFIIDFFATWCKPCNRELSAIADVYDEWKEETGVKIYAVSIDQGQNINKVKPLVDQNEWEYEVLLDPNSELLKALGGQMIPSPQNIAAIPMVPRTNSSRKCVNSLASRVIANIAE